ncbi:hypothetical protein ACFXB3_28200, partial [Streptomyces sp. NPDC059447]
VSRSPTRPTSTRSPPTVPPPPPPRPAPQPQVSANTDVLASDVNLLLFWNTGTTLAALLDLDMRRSGTNRKLRPDHD